MLVRRESFRYLFLQGNYIILAILKPNCAHLDIEREFCKSRCVLTCLLELSYQLLMGELVACFVIGPEPQAIHQDIKLICRWGWCLFFCCHLFLPWKKKLKYLVTFKDYHR